MESTGILVFARLDSRRLPGKALLPLAGRPMLARVLDRVRRTPGSTAVTATSARATDDPIAALSQEMGIAVFRGDCDDVLGRCVACARHFGFRRIVRISGDSPFIAPELIADVLALQARSGAGVATNVHPRSFPPGQSVEVVSAEALELAAAEASSAEDREHVTPWLYRHAERVGVANLQAPDPDWGALRLVVDDAADRAFAEMLTTRLGPEPHSASLATVMIAAAELSRIRAPLSSVEDCA